jgi:hypothetical protein
MSTQKSIIPPLNISKVHTKGVFLDSIRLNSALNYYDIKDFPIWWSGFYVDNTLVDNQINSFKTKRERTKKQMLAASRKTRGFSCLDLKPFLNPQNEFQNTHTIAITSHDSFISFDKELTKLLDSQGYCVDSSNIPIYSPRSRPTRLGTQRGQHTPLGLGTQRGQHTPLGLGTQRGQHSPTRRGTQRGQHSPTRRGTQRGQHSPTRRGTQRGQHSPTRRGTQRKSKSGVTMNQDNDFSRKFTKLALESSPENIGLFVNCTPAQFIEKIFYNIEFDIIRAHYETIKKNVNLFIFNISPNKCYDIKEKIQLIIQDLKYNKLENNTITDINSIIEILQDKNCYQTIRIVDEIKEQIDLLDSKLQKNKSYKLTTYFKTDVVKDAMMDTFNTSLLRSLDELLKNKNCFFITKKFEKKINALKEKKITTNNLPKTLKEIKEKQEKLIELQISISDYFKENDEDCFDIYNKLKKTLKTLNSTSPVDIDKIKLVLAEINQQLDDANNRSCFEITKLLKEKQKADEKYITFHCNTCNSLADCAIIINQKIKNPE